MSKRKGFKVREFEESLFDRRTQFVVLLFAALVASVVVVGLGFVGSQAFKEQPVKEASDEDVLNGFAIECFNETTFADLTTLDFKGYDPCLGMFFESYLMDNGVRIFVYYDENGIDSVLIKTEVLRRGRS